MSDPQRWRELIDRHLDGELTGPEAAELQRAVRQHPEAATELQRAVELEIDLLDSVGPGIPRVPATPPSRSIPWTAAAAALLLLAVVVVLVSRDGVDPSSSPTKGVGNAPTDGVWSDPAERRFAAGEVWTREGLEVEFLSDARLVVDSDDVIELRQGRARVQYRGPSRHRVRTPVGELAAASSELFPSYELRIHGSARGTAMRSSIISSLLVLVGAVMFTPVDDHGANAETPVVITAQSGEATLAADGSIGTIRDREGIALRRPLASDRWTVVEEGHRLHVGTWLKTGARGAHAVAFELADGTRLTLGPATQIELSSLNSLRLIRGEVHVVPAGESFSINSTGGEAIAVSDATTIANRDAEIVRLDEEPRWLVGYRGDRTTDALGSLLAKVDGRDVPLTMGYHKVSVDIRDQIARTVIEESFINHTSNVLEGVFYFPLPAGASVSGFAMWIGGEKVHGEIIEKQRARAIYETILRERRDPGLLEWTGGSVFKARVFPIVGEKRIEISYTQVLRKSGGGNADEYRYRYRLASELTRLTPLAHLELQVRVASSQPIRRVTCPSHPCRIESTVESARVTYSADAVIPTRDFEVRVELEPSSSPVRAITHRRGDDGYLMLLLDALPLSGDAAPGVADHDVIFVVDTSGSITEAAGQAQLAFVETMLSGLDESDRFAVLTVDSELRWLGAPAPSGGAGLAGERHEVTPSSVVRALEFIEGRGAFGGTRLADALAAASRQATAKTTIVYLGDGVDTYRYFDPTDLLDAVRGDHRHGRLHAVAVGPHEARVMTGLATLSGGSVRSADNVELAVRAADQLLAELSQPTIEGLGLTVEGVDIAAVHPQVLPNLPVGSQTIVVGRYDARQRVDRARVVVRGRLGDANWETEYPLTLRTEDGGNSFIPRLWARRHLDHLLDQGGDPRVRDTVIALSEDFQIATPYTSFLVLENDEDRERFGVEKRMRIRDGEEFFAEGREKVDFELGQKAMLAAKTWRVGLRREVLEMIADLGRSHFDALAHDPMLQSLGYGYAKNSWGVGSGGGGGGGDLFCSFSALPGSSSAPVDGANEIIRYKDRVTLGDDDEDMSGSFSDAPLAEELEATLEMTKKSLDGRFQQSNESFSPAGSPAMKLPFSKRTPIDGYGGWSYSNRAIHGLPWTSSLLTQFPPMPAPHVARPRAQWPAEVLARLDRLDRRGLVEETSLVVRTTTVHRDVRGEALPPARGDWLLGADRWLYAPVHRDGDAHSLHWLVDGERGTVRADWLLGRVRPREVGDDDGWGLPMGPYFDHLAAYYRAYEFDRVEVVEAEDGTSLLRLVLRYPGSESTTVEVDIDEVRQVITEERTLDHGEVTSRHRYHDFVQVAGRWWPAKSTMTGRDEWLSRTAEYQVEALPSEELARRITERLRLRERAILLRELREDRLVALQAVRTAATEGVTPTLEDLLQVTDYYVARQRWDRVEPYWQRLVSQLGDRLGRSRLELAKLGLERRNEELRVLALAVADRLATGGDGLADRAAADDLYNQTQALGWSERLELAERLGGVYARLRRTDAERDHYYRVYQCVQGIGDYQAARDNLRRLCSRFPERVAWHQEYARLLASLGEVDAGLRWLRETERDRGPWAAAAIQQFRRTKLDVLHEAGRYADVVRFVEAWLDRAERDEESPPDQYQLEKYLADLLRLDRVDELQSRMETWLALPFPDDDGLDQARRSAALRMAMGQGHAFWIGRAVPRWHPALVDLANRAFEAEELAIFLTVFSDHGFAQTDAGRALHATFADRLVAEADLSIPQSLLLLTATKHDTLNGKPGEELRRRYAEELLARWIASDDEDRGDGLVSFIDRFGSDQNAIDYWRYRVERADEEHMRRAALTRWVSAILTAQIQREAESGLDADDERQLIAAVEQELSGLLAFDESAPSAERVNRVRSALQLTRRIVDGYQRTYVDARVAANAESGDWSRRELSRRRKEIRAEGRLRARTILGRVSLDASSASREVSRHIALERIWLGAQGGVDREVLTDEATKVLSLALAEGPDDSEDEAEEIDGLRELALDRALASRAFFTLVRPAADSGNSEAGVDDLLRFVREEAERDTPRFAADRWLVTLLIAVDRVEPLLSRLRQLFGDGQRTEQLSWGRLLAYLSAEQGQFDAAIDLFRKLTEIDVLSAEEYEALSSWHRALGQRDGWRAARIQSFEARDEWQLASWIRTRGHAQNEDGVPLDLDPDIELAFVALFRKSTNPSNHTHLLRELYGRTRDFRLLQALAEGTLGQSAQGVYLLMGSWRFVVEMLQEEATLDRVVAEIERLRRGEITDVDRRGLALAEFYVRQRALEISHGTEEHERAVLAALAAADQTEFAYGEPEAKANLLAAFGRLRSPAVIEEFLRQIVACENAVPRGSAIRVRIAFHHATVLANHERVSEAVRVAETALKAAREADDDRLPPELHRLVPTLGQYYQRLGRYRDGEKLWRRELSIAYPEVQRMKIRELWLRYLISTYQQKGAITLGSGDELYEAILDECSRFLALDTNEGHALQVVQQLVQLWQSSRIPESRRDERVLDFAFRELPSVLSRYQHRRSSEFIRTVASSMEAVLGPVPALRFLVARSENEPRWLALRNHDFWAQHGYTVARYRRRAGDAVPAELAQRILRLALTELERDLRTRQSRQPAIYHDDHNDFWPEQREAYVRVAARVAEEESNSGVTIAYIARYYRDGLGRSDDALAVLRTAHRRGVLGAFESYFLAEFLRDVGRASEAVPIAEELYARRHGGLDSLGLFVSCLAKSGQGGRALQTLTTAEARLREGGALDESTVATLAGFAGENELHSAAVRFAEEAIQLRRRRTSGRSGDGQLARYYDRLARSLSALGRTAKAVDAAAGAIVTWGSNQHGRSQALDRLRSVLRVAKDLDVFVETFEGDVIESGLENPILRRALGQVFAERAEYRRAVHHYEHALAVQPEDRPTHDALVAAHDRLGQDDDAIAALRRATETFRGDLELYRELGRRLLAAERAAEAERAYTTMIDVRPDEAEAHSALAARRADQLDHDGAARHWRQVTRIRSDEPAGYVALARELIAGGETSEAREVIQELRTREWPERFGDQSAVANELEAKLP